MNSPLEQPSNELTELVFEMLGATASFFDEVTAKPDSLDANLIEVIDHVTQSDVQSQHQEPWVLCIEDDHDFSLALQLRLKQHGISVIRAFEGVGGVRTAMTRPAEAIILDYNLPNGRGDFVLRRLKSNPLTAAIPVIVVSGQKRMGLEKEMLHLGAVRCLAKPIRFDEILDELRNHIPVRS